MAATRHLRYGRGQDRARGDGAAVEEAITSPWSNSQTEGQITKLKLVKRQMYNSTCSRPTSSVPGQAGTAGAGGVHGSECAGRPAFLQT